ncbi:MAG: Holliday junction resolvase [Thermoplasmata archaeon]|nr:Holliday junction resolvase [Thermoplasmata archaeon]MCI4338437.1 Holliday junction resolvase [Thermoplasmata archaeon]MCI4341931.1 Holliday junction resolvase [Thermoplasmata archaeon]
MNRSSSAYERELKQILQGTAGESGQGPNGHAPFLVVRAAGSLGFDLVALRPEFAFPIEVKASHSATIHFSAASGRAAEQLEAHRQSVERVGLLALYAFRRLGRRTGDPWRLFVAPGPPHRGRLGLLRRRLPPIDATRTGHAVLRWEDGMALGEFLSCVTGLVEPPG